MVHLRVPEMTHLEGLLELWNRLKQGVERFRWRQCGYSPHTTSDSSTTRRVYHRLTYGHAHNQ